MILVVLGTHELPFTRLLKEVDRLKKEGFLTDKIVVQNGHTKFESEDLTFKQFVSYEEMENLFEEARFVITHAGTGSVITGLKKGKKLIVAPRLQKYGEHNDDHQLELVNVFVEAGHILSWLGEDNLEAIVEKVNHFSPLPFRSEKQKMLNLLKDYIDGI